MSSPISVVVSGVPGKLASAVARGIAGDDSTNLSGVYNPGRSGEWEGFPYVDGPQRSQVVVEAGPADSVMANLALWREADVATVVGTSGFTDDKIAQVEDLWEGATHGCLIVPNFSVGAVLMMRFAELAAPHFETIEVIERHGQNKPDAPSGTALATAARIAGAGGKSVSRGEELAEGSRGGDVGGVMVHSMRLAGLVSHQEVASTNPGEQFSIVHQSTSYASFAGGAVAAVNGVGAISGVEVGLDGVLGLA